MWTPLTPILRCWSPVEVHRTMPHAASAVFDTIADPYTYPSWLVGAQRMRAVDDDFPSPGSEFHHSVGIADEATIDDVSRVLSVDPPRCLELEVTVGPVRGIVVMRVEPTDLGCTVTFRERPDGLAAVLTPFTRVGLGARNTESLRRLDDLLAGRTEATSAVEGDDR